jgi:hypothetical protein
MPVTQLQSLSSGQPGFFDAPSSTSTLNQVDIWNPQQQALFNQLGTMAGQPAPTYQGNMSAGQNPYESQYFNYVSGVPQNTQAMQTALQNSLQPAYDTSAAATQKYWQDTVLPGQQKIFNENVLPQFREQFAGPQFWSENRAGQTNQLFDKYNQNLTSQYGDLQYKDELARRTALENAMNRVAPAAQASGQLSNMTSGVLNTAGQTGRTIDQEKIAGDLQKWLMGGADSTGQVNTMGNPSMQLAQSLLGLSPYAFQNQTVNTGAGMGYGAAQGAASGVGAAAAKPVMDAAGNIIGYGADAASKLLSSLFGGSGLDLGGMDSTWGLDGDWTF